MSGEYFILRIEELERRVAALENVAREAVLVLRDCTPFNDGDFDALDKALADAGYGG